MNPASTQDLLNHAWFGLIGLMLVLYVVTDGFDLGVGILTLLRRREADRDLMVQSIGHVWDANETWLVALGGALFGAFPAAYAMILSDLYVPVMVLIASFIMRGAAIEFRHAAHTSKMVWDRVFGLGSLLAAISQGIVLGKILTGFVPYEKLTPEQIKEFNVKKDDHFNLYFPGHRIAMPPPLQDGTVNYVDGTKNTLQQEASDVVQFLAWASEPHLEARNRTGWRVILFLLAMGALMYAVKRAVWADAH